MLLTEQKGANKLLVSLTLPVYSIQFLNAIVPIIHLTMEINTNSHVE